VSRSRIARRQILLDLFSPDKIDIYGGPVIPEKAGPFDTGHSIFDHVAVNNI
jgi:hypothetical protein